MSSLRTPKNEKIYQEFLKSNKNRCPFCLKDLLVKEFKFWILVENKFPYNKIAVTHHLLAPKIHIAEFEELKNWQREELKEIIKKIEKNYSYISLNVKKKRTIKDHFHLHLIKIK
jgi:diadenosine tetraphosphate (Ap4A) HIT family hydrolase